MARTIGEIYDTSVQKYKEYMSLNGFVINPEQWSATSFLRLTFYVFAFLSHGLEKILNTERKDIEQYIADYKPRTVRWYRTKALEFQFGYSLPDGAINYDNTNNDPTLVANSKIIKYAATSGVLKGVKVKVAGESGGDLVPIHPSQLAPLQEYLDRIKGPGVRIYLSSSVADQLFASLKFYYNPEILSSVGKRLDGTNDAPVLEAINNFLKNLRFDGLFIVAHFIDALQAVNGIEIPEVIEIKAKYAAVDWLQVGTSYQPDSGFIRLVTFNPTYIPFNNQ